MTPREDLLHGIQIFGVMHPVGRSARFGARAAETMSGLQVGELAVGATSFGTARGFDDVKD